MVLRKGKVVAQKVFAHLAHKNELHEQKGDDVEGGAENMVHSRTCRGWRKSKICEIKSFSGSYVYYQMFVVCAAFWLLVASLVGA